MSTFDTPAGLVCPKCQGAMRAYERNGVTIDQCADCRGVFLDRGELERLVDAESSYYERSAPVAPVPQPPQAQRGYYDDDDDHRRKHYGDNDYYKKKRRKSFLSELFDD